MPTDLESPVPEEGTADVPAIVRRVPRVGVWAWSFVGVVAATVILVIALAAVSEIVLPLTFAAVLGVMFKPFVDSLQRRGLKPTAAAGLVVLGLLALMVGVVTATVTGVLDQTDEIGASADAALATLSEELDIDQATLDDARASAEEATPAVTTGFMESLVEGFSVAAEVAGAIILGALIMYYLLKDGARLRQSVVSQVDKSIRAEVDDFIGDACRILRDYGKGRTVMSLVVSVVIGVAALLLGLPLVFTIVVVNFVGGYIPYVGAFLGGGLAVIVAVGDGGLAQGAIMLVVVLVANLALENFVEPRVMGRTLDIHPLVVLVVTALGGIVGGIVGLILAVPAWVVAGSALKRLRSHGVLDSVAEKAQPAVARVLDA